MLKFMKVEIRRNESHTLPLEVAAWEVPILQAVHGDVEVIEEKLVDREAPDAADEFARLANRYGQVRNEDGGKGIPYVASVYGNFGPGTATLARAIKAAVVETVTREQAQIDDLLGESVSSVGG